MIIFCYLFIHIVKSLLFIFLFSKGYAKGSAISKVKVSS